MDYVYCNLTDEGIVVTYDMSNVELVACQNNQNILTANIKVMLKEAFTKYDGQVTNIRTPVPKYVGNSLVITVPCDIITPKQKPLAGDNIVSAMRARGFDFHTVLNHEDVFINTSTWDSTKDEALYNKYGLRGFREGTGEKHFVLYDPISYEVASGVGCKYLRYTQPVQLRGFELPINASSMYRMFAEFKGKNIDLKHVDLSNIVTMEEAFEYSKRLEFVRFGEQDCSKLIDISSMFSNCYKMKAVDMNGVKTPNLQYISGMCTRCRGLVSVDINNLDVRKVMKASYVFLECENLTQIDLSNWELPVTCSTVGFFSSCENLQAVNLEKLNLVGSDNNFVELRRHMFACCCNLYFVYILNVNLTGEAGNGRKIFYFCNELYKLYGNLNDRDMFNALASYSKQCKINALNDLKNERLEKLNGFC